MTKDMINPAHYKGDVVECIEIMEQMNSPLLANALKYIWRLGMKGSASEDIDKAAWYLNRWASSHLKEGAKGTLGFSRKLFVREPELAWRTGTDSGARAAVITGIILVDASKGDAWPLVMMVTDMLWALRQETAT